MLTYKYNVDLCVNGVKLSVILPFLLDWRYAPNLAAFLMETRLTATRKHKSCDRPPQGTCRANSNRKNTGALSLSTIYLTWKPKNLLKKLNRLYYQLLIPLLFRVKKLLYSLLEGSTFENSENPLQKERRQIGDEDRLSSLKGFISLKGNNQLCKLTLYWGPFFQRSLHPGNEVFDVQALRACT